MPGLNSDETNFFSQAKVRFQEIDSVSGAIESGSGLGPSFNGNSCAQCHVQPAIGGGSPPTANPQVTLATLDGAKNTVPPFVANGGPIREARLITNGGKTDGNVHDLYVITGRTDATNQPNANTGTNTTCGTTQINWPQQIAANNVIFRIPISTFGDGLIENINDQKLMNSASNASSTASNLGITVGRFNHSGNDGTITKFGWKAQNKSLLMFAGEAYNVEQGVTNELFTNERRFEDINCLYNATPEDATNLENTRNTNSPASDFASDIVNFAAFTRLLNQPSPAAATASTKAGLTAFQNIGCAVCHTPSLTTDASIFTGQSRVTVNAFSDFALHEMGTVVLADFVSQGQADGDDFRSAPLFGIGQRAFFLHDGRTRNLVTAIEDHADGGSEANQVIANFNNLAASDQQNIINFLRSL